MGAIQEFDIFLDDSLEVYHCGEKLTGHVLLTLTKDLAMKGIRVSLRGEARTQWREKLPPVAFRSRRGALVRSVDPFLCHRMTVWGKEPEDDSEIPLLQAGQYNFPFKFILPNQPALPCSFECGRFACIRFYVQATIDISWAVDPVAERYFSFLGNELDVNLTKYTKSVQASDRKSMRWRCRSSGPIALKAEMQRSAYCSGEYINIRTRLENNSDKTMKLRVKLLQNVDIMAGTTKRHTRKGSYEVLSYTSPPVLPEQEFILQTARMLQIPILPPTIDCQLIRVRYVIKVSLLVDEKPELNILFPTVIGNVPFKGKENSQRQISYGYACQRSCGGNIDTVHYSDGDKVFHLKPFTPLYLTVFPIYDTSLSSQNGALIGGLYRNSSRGIPNGNTIHDGINGSVPKIVPHTRGKEQLLPIHMDSFNSEIEESITISNQSASSVTKVNTRSPAQNLSTKASSSGGSSSTPESLQNSRESIINATEKINGFAGIENKGFANSTDELSKTNVLVHPEIHAEDLRKTPTTRSATKANGVCKDYRQLSIPPVNPPQNVDHSSGGDIIKINDLRIDILKGSMHKQANGLPGNRRLIGDHVTQSSVNKDPETGQLEIPVQVEYYKQPEPHQYYTDGNNLTEETKRIDSISPDLVQGSPKPTNRRRLHSKKPCDNKSKVYVGNGNSHQKSNSDDVTVQLSTISDMVYTSPQTNGRQYGNGGHMQRGQSLTRHYSADYRDEHLGRSSLSSDVSSASDENQDTRPANSLPAPRYDKRVTQRYIPPQGSINGHINESLPYNGMQPNGRTSYKDDYKYQIREDNDLTGVASLNGIVDDYPLESFSLTL